MMFCVLFNSSKVNKMHITILSQKVGWLGNKGVNIDLWDSMINFHK